MGVLSKGIRQRFRRLLNLPSGWTPPRNVETAAAECLAWVNERVNRKDDRVTLPLEFRAELRMRLAKLVQLLFGRLATLTDDQDDGRKVLVRALYGDSRELAQLYPRPAKRNEPLKWLPPASALAEEGRMLQVLRALRLMSKPCVTSRAKQKATLPGDGAGTTGDGHGGGAGGVHGNVTYNVEKMDVRNEIRGSPGATMMTHSVANHSFNQPRADRSRKPAHFVVAWLRDHVLGGVIVAILTGLAGWKGTVVWAWIREWLGW